MLKQKLKEMQDCTLWWLLADISEIMSSERHKDHEETAAFWLSAAADIKNEIDRRLFDSSDDLDD